MKSAIIFGGNGLIGKSLTNQLQKVGIPYLIIGSSPQEAYFFDGVNVQSANLGLLYSSSLKWKLDDPVLFNLAWRGDESLMGGGLQTQIKNLDLLTNIDLLINQFTPKKIISLGSMEEVVFRRSIEKNNWVKYNSNQSNWYGFAKESARQQLSFMAYVKKINYWHCQLSVAINTRLNSCKYIERNLKNILQKKNYETAQSSQLFNIASVEEISRQIIHVGKYGINKITYQLGTEFAITLSDFFKTFQSYTQMGYKPKLLLRKLNQQSDLLSHSDFSIDDLKNTNSYRLQEDIDTLFKKISEATL
jgi:nucleoside-diphosphate-sugar epimerase